MISVVSSLSSTQWFNGNSDDASVPLGSVNSSSDFFWVVETVYNNCALKATGGGFGLPGTSKSTFALHVSASSLDLMTHVWLLPYGLIVTEEPAITISFLSPSCM